MAKHPWCRRSGSQGSAPLGTDKKRSTVKGQARDAAMSGELTPAGQATAPVGSGLNTDHGRAMTPQTSEKTRTGVKAQANAPKSSGSTQPAGEAPQPAGEATKK